jgi:hypothetical protein
MPFRSVGINRTPLESYNLDEGGLEAVDGMGGPNHG